MNVTLSDAQHLSNYRAQWLRVLEALISVEDSLRKYLIPIQPLSTFENDAGKTANSIVCCNMAITQLVIISRKMAIIQLVMDKCCSSDEFFTPLPMRAMMPERPKIPSFAVKWL